MTNDKASIRIGNRMVGVDNPCLVVAEMSANHGGDIVRALEIVHAAAESGADAIKIQTYTADTITMNSHREWFNIDEGTWDGENLYELYQRAFTPWEWHARIKEEAEREGLIFFSTPFDPTAVDFLEELNVDLYKIASFELIDIPLIRRIAKCKKPIIMSTGMGTLSEIDEAVRTIRGEGNDQMALLRCASAYPAITDEMNLKTMQNMAETFGVPVGLSDHSMGSVGAVTAVALGAAIIEKHFCLSREIETADSSFSMEPSEFAMMVRDIRQAETALGKVTYGPTPQERLSLEARKSIFITKHVKAGEKLTPENTRVIRPGQGLHPRYYDEVLGQVALVDIDEGTPLEFSMIGRAHREGTL